MTEATASEHRSERQRARSGASAEPKHDPELDGVTRIAPRRHDWDWQLRAACRGTDTGTFYHPENERGPRRLRRELRAKEVCARCPVQAPCLAWALETREPYGVWGGLSVEEREAMLASRPA